MFCRPFSMVILVYADGVGQCPPPSLPFLLSNVRLQHGRQIVADTAAAVDHEGTQRTADRRNQCHPVGWVRTFLIDAALLRNDFPYHPVHNLNQQNKLVLWSERVSACRESGQSVKNWCKSHNICEKTFYKWQKKLFVMSITSKTALRKLHL